MSESKENSAWADVSLLVGFPMAVRAALTLGIPKILDSAELALSARQICERLERGDKHVEPSAENLEKLLDWLCLNGVFSVQVEVSDGGTEVRRFSHSPKSRCLSLNLLAEGILFFTDPVLNRAWSNLHHIVLNPSVSAFELTNGKPFYSYLAEEAPDLQRVYVGWLKRVSIQASSILQETYDSEFRALRGRVVDVGGQEGALCQSLAAKYSQIQFVNLDLPEVVRTAPAIPGVEHIGGSFLDSVPQGEFLLMKFVLLNWDDEQCIQILKNCRQALAGGGKMVIMDRVVPSDPKEARSAHWAWAKLQNPVILERATLRTLEHLKRLAVAAGFSSLEPVNGFKSSAVSFDFLEATP